MLLFLLLIAAAPDLPPAADDPAGLWIARAIAVLVPISAIIAAKIQAKKNPSNGPTPLASPDSSTPRLDVGQAYLAQFVTHLTDRVRLTEAKNEDLERKYLEVLEKYATTRADLATTNVRLEAVLADNVELRDEVNILRGRLRGRDVG